MILINEQKREPKAICNAEWQCGSGRFSKESEDVT
ncbi:Protein CBG26764 [Caenorhabditis briggsae]|uniref:Protein CBG26764 n=1 Tax=Caenorhabditis briggsae TaxID=6238 RepID=B6IED7_CAEBR|nr:Protein CBG26764 [Caenorhabditis briggsae]CAS01201.1 Protein CBG26764 [Caenorhabditis briggsae]